ncbi:MAG: hypothetical protein HFJ66_00425 [Eggerthellaceae bacterium]|nr:hypothetical protein [Eggerthellaceae bacterium]
MLHDSYPWRNEIRKLIEDLQAIRLPSEYDEEDDGDFRIERALLYSAYATRLLLDAGKMTDEANEYRLSVGVMPNIMNEPEKIQPLFRRVPDSECYDYASEQTKTVLARRILNQIIHSFVVIMYEVDELGRVMGFYVTSDYAANTELYHIKMDNWIEYLTRIVDNEIAEMHSYFDSEKGRWTTYSS